MPTLADLKAQHPEWCFGCGDIFRDHHEVQHHEDANMCVKMSILVALIAKALEDEARIEEMLKIDWDEFLADKKERQQLEGRMCHAESQLAAEREAHEITRKALEEADRALLFWRGYSEYIFLPDMEYGQPRRAAQNALAREAERQKGKVPDAD